VTRVRASGALITRRTFRGRTALTASRTGKLMLTGRTSSNRRPSIAARASAKCPRWRRDRGAVVRCLDNSSQIPVRRCVAALSTPGRLASHAALL